MNERLTAFIAEMSPTDDGVSHHDAGWWVDFAHPFRDFNKEIAHPGTLKKYPHGVVGIRVDDDFWVVAELPYEFAATPVEEIVQALWPGIKNATFKPDAVIEKD